jgi:hypothetical protein
MNIKYKYTKQELEEVVSNSLSIAQVCTQLGIKAAGGNYKTLKARFIDWNIDTSHFTGKGWNVGLKFIPNPPKPLSEILVINSNYTNSNCLRKRLLKEGVKEYKCESCNSTEWLGNPIPLEIHHINGDNMDHRIDNIQILCPNCHSLTSTHRGRNIGR